MIKLLFRGVHVSYLNEKDVCISVWQISFIPPARLPSNPHLPALQSTPNRCGQPGCLVVYFVCNPLASCRLTWHIINSRKVVSAIRTLCLWIGSEIAQPLLALSAHLTWIIHSMAERGITSRCDPVNTYHSVSVVLVKVNVSQVQTRVIYSLLSHFALD